MGRRLGVSGQAIYKWEKGHNKIERAEMLDLALQTLERETLENIQGNLAARNALGEAIKAERLRLEMGQAEAAEAIGVEQSKLSAYERGVVRFPPPERLVALARLYGRPDTYFVEIANGGAGAREE